MFDGSPAQSPCLSCPIGFLLAFDIKNAIWFFDWAGSGHAGVHCLRKSPDVPVNVTAGVSALSGGQKQTE